MPSRFASTAIRPWLPGLVLGACASLALSAPSRVDAGQKGKVAMEKVEFGGWKNNLRLTNGDAELILTLDVGPRILSYRLADGRNVLKEYADQFGKSGESGWMIRGGHRLWTAPEDLTRTYSPDNGPVAHEVLPDGTVRLKQSPDGYGIRKEIDVKLDDRGSGVTLTHRLENVGAGPTDLAPWALTVMSPGGVEIIPLPTKAPHPGGSADAKSAEDFAPNQALVLWPYFDFADDRWTFGHSFITLRQKNRGPTKLGLTNTPGWVGYLNGGTLFVKTFAYQAGKPYPDRGANYETFSNEDMVELESLGPLVRLLPGEAAEHVEGWRLVGGLGDVDSESEIEKVILPAIRGR